MASPAPDAGPAGERAHAADVAAGRFPADVALLGGTLVDVYSRRTRQADVAFAGSRIAAVGNIDHCLDAATEIHDCHGLYLLPGLLDPHFHVAFSQLSVERLAELLLPLGTVALSACFSESASIIGSEAVEEQLARAEGTGLDLLLSPFYTSALGPSLGKFGAEDLLAQVRDDRCVELREWSDRAAQTLPEPLQQAWVEAFERRRTIAGHMEGQIGHELQASVARGVVSDHETTTVAQALERVQLGVTVQMRQGSGGRDLLTLLPAITEHGADPDLFSFCADEQELADIVANGHIDGKMRVAVAHGVAPIDVVRMATLNSARSLGLELDYGAVVPGRLASLALVEDLTDFRVAMTFSRGRLRAQHGRYQADAEPDPYPAAWSDTVHVARALRAEDFALALPDGAHEVRVIGATPGSIKSVERVEHVTVADGRLSEAAGLAKLAVADRHRASGRIEVGLIAGLDIEHGALASTINAGSFNLMVVGVDEEAMALAANRAVELGGGIVVARDGSIKAELPLPLFGIVSHAPLAESVANALSVAAAVRDELGSPFDNLVACAGFSCLPGVGKLKLTDRGLVRIGESHERELVGLAADAQA